MFLLAALSVSRVYGDALDNWYYSQVVTNTSGFGFGFADGFTLRSITFGNNRFVAVGAAYLSDPGIIQTSDDGMNWTVRATLNQSVAQVFDLAFGNGVFVAVGWGGLGNNNIYRSTDGVNWTSYPSGFANLNGVTFGAGRFVAIGDCSYVTPGPGYYLTNRSILTSTDGISWSAKLSGADNDIRTIWDVAYGNGLFVAVDGKYIYRSTDGNFWGRILPVNVAVGNGVYFCNNRFFMPGLTNLLSFDGLTWSPMTKDVTNAFGSMIYGNGQYVALAGTNLFTSTNSTNWIQRSLQTTNNLGAAAFGQDNLVVLGSRRGDGRWYPVAYVSDPFVGLSINSGFPPQIQVSGLAGRSYRLEYLSDLRSNDWQTLSTFTLSNSPTIIVDNQATNSSRFYRRVLLP